jgi:hypothetical protein
MRIAILEQGDCLAALVKIIGLDIGSKDKIGIRKIELALDRGNTAIPGAVFVMLVSVIVLNFGRRWVMHAADADDAAFLCDALYFRAGLRDITTKLKHPAAHDDIESCISVTKMMNIRDFDMGGIREEIDAFYMVQVKSSIYQGEQFCFRATADRQYAHSGRILTNAIERRKNIRNEIGSLRQLGEEHPFDISVVLNSDLG